MLDAIYIHIYLCMYIMGIAKGPLTNVGPGPSTSLIRSSRKQWKWLVCGKSLLFPDYPHKEKYN